jgi:hypothetical protein
MKIIESPLSLGLEQNKGRLVVFDGGIRGAKGGVSAQLEI